MSDDDDDYMSDKFLTGDSDVRPSLINNRAKKRQLLVQYKQKENTKKQRETKASTSTFVNNDKLQVALSKPLESENKGFKLLAKMGYKPGQALGKIVANENSVSGEQRLLVPIGITIKTGRQGLGREAALKELKQKQLEIRMQRMKKEIGGETSIEEFRRRATQKAEERFVASALRRCQKTCGNLDMDSQINTPAMPWFWPEKPKEPEDTESTEAKNEGTESEEEVDEEFSNAEKMEMLTNYIRTSYNFCYWCGVRYEDEADLNENCPGLTKDDH